MTALYIYMITYNLECLLFLLVLVLVVYPWHLSASSYVLECQIGRRIAVKSF